MDNGKVNIYIGGESTNRNKLFFDRIVKYNFDKKTVIIAPENKLYYYENKILNLKKGINTNIELLSFSRMPYILFKKTKNRNNIYIDEIIKEMYLSKIIEEEKKKTNLIIFNNDKLVKEIGNIFSNIFENGIQRDQIESYIDKEENNILSLKMKDILTIYDKYIEKKLDKLDKEEIYTKIFEDIDNNNYFDNADIYIVGFNTFKEIQLTNEAQLQIKLSLLSDKLIEQKKYKALKGKSIVGIGGKFSAGKSKFINSILNAEEGILPEDQNPTTSIPTYLMYGEDEQILAYTNENLNISLDKEALQALTHKFFEKYKIGFSSFINSLIIFEPNMTYKDLVFLDTPGYSKADFVQKNQKELTDENKAYTQLRTVNYLIWLMDIENGVLTESDIDFIQKLNLEEPILIVINKSDKKTNQEIQNIVNIVEKTAKNAGIKVFKVVAYSSRNKEEWRNTNKIQDYLKLAMADKKNRDDILEEIKRINISIFNEINRKKEEKIQERNQLNDIIFKSNDIMEIKTLVELYGEAMSEIHNIKKCMNKYEFNIKKLENELNKHYNRG